MDWDGAVLFAGSMVGLPFLSVYPLRLPPRPSTERWRKTAFMYLEAADLGSKIVTFLASTFGVDHIEPRLSSLLDARAGV